MYKKAIVEYKGVFKDSLHINSNETTFEYDGNTPSYIQTNPTTIQLIKENSNMHSKAL